MDIVERSNAAYAAHVEASGLYNKADYQGAAEKWKECSELCTNEPLYLRSYANCLAHLKRWSEGLTVASLAAEMDPINPEAWALMAGAHGNLGNQDDYIRCLNRSITLAPNAPSTMWNRSLWHLLHGNYAQGWAEYEWRFMLNQRPRTLKPSWDGNPIPGKTLLISSEQGYGDTIQFVRFVRRARAQSQARIILEIQDLLIPLFHGREAELGFDELTTMPMGLSVPLHESWEWISLMSLPNALFIYDESQFWDTEPGYLWAKPWDCANHSEPRIGICWAGTNTHSHDEVRSINGDEFLRSIGATATKIGAQLHSINPSCPIREDIGFNGRLDTFADTARTIAGLDLVITVDTAVAHLAGAMGKPVWILIRYATDWRWCVNHPTSSPWYPSARLFRQKSYDGGWGEVLAEVATALGEFAQPKPNTIDPNHSKYDNYELPWNANRAYKLTHGGKS